MGQRKTVAGFIGATIIGLALGCSIGSTSAAEEAVSAKSATFNAVQRQAIESIVRDFLLENPEILVEVSIALEAKRAEAEKNAAAHAIKTMGDAIFNDGISPVAGNPNGSITVVEYFDYNCGYCRRAMKTVLELVEKEKDVKVIFKELPVLGDASHTAAIASLAAARQDKFLEFHTALMTYEGRVSENAIEETAKTVGLDLKKFQSDRADPALEAAVQANLAQAEAMYITGTPSFIVNETVVPGWAEEEIRRLIKEARES